MKRISKSINGKEISLMGINADLMAWYENSEYCKTIFFSFEDAENLLFLSLGSHLEADRVTASKKLINKLWYLNEFLGPYPFLETLSDFEFDRVFYPGYRDHVSHQLKVFLLGLYFFENCPLVKDAVLNKINYSDSYDDDIKEFCVRWLVTAVYHDLGYVIENEQTTEKIGGIWLKTQSEINEVLSSPLSCLPTFSNLSKSKEFKIKQKHKIWNLEIKYPQDIEYDGSNDFLDMIKDAAINSSLGYIDENYSKSPFRAYYDFAFTQKPKGRNRFRDHGIASSLFLLKIWHYFFEYISQLSKIDNEPLLSYDRPQILALGKSLKKQRATIIDAAASIALHNINKEIWDTGEALSYNLTLEDFTIELESKTEKAAPLAFLLRIVDALQEWDRPSFSKPKEEINSLTDQDMNINTKDGQIYIYIQKDAERFKKPEDDPNSIYHNLLTEASNYLNITTINKTICWGLLDEKKSRVKHSESISKNLISERLKSENEKIDFQKTTEIIKEEKDWIVGAVNFDEDLHFSSFYLFQSLKVNLPDNLNDFGYDTIIATYNNFNETYYIPKTQCKNIASLLLNKIKENPLWFQDVLENIKRKTEELYQVFPFENEMTPFEEMADYELFKYYVKHNNQHVELYKYARIPETLDRGINYFTNYLKNYLKEHNPELEDLINLNSVFEILTFPEDISVAGMEMIEFYNLIERIRNEEGLEDLFRGSTRRILLEAEPELLEEIKTYCKKWLFWGYHGYGNRALRDFNHFLKKFKNEITNEHGEQRRLKLAEKMKTAEEHRLKTFGRYSVDNLHQTLFRLYSRIGTTKLYRRYVQLRNFYFLDQIISEFSKRLKVKEGFIRNLLPNEIINIFKSNTDISEFKDREQSKTALVLNKNHKGIITGDQAEILISGLESITTIKHDSKSKLIGTPAASGFASNRCTVIKREYINESHIKKGEILISEDIDPDLIEIIKEAGAVITETGGVTCHAAIMCRELGIPAIVGVKGLLNSVRTGDLVEVNANEGYIIVKEEAERSKSIIDDDSSHNMNSQDIGNKALNIIELKNHGINTPPLFCIPWRSLRSIFQEGSEDNTGEEIKNFWKEVTKAIDNLKGNLFAIRSSTKNEDNPEFSGAGLECSELHVSKEDIVKTLDQIITNGLSSDINGSIIIQEMILGDISGITFTIEPIERDKSKILIEAVLGGNENLTSGNITPVRYLIDKKTQDIIKDKKNYIKQDILNSEKIVNLSSIANNIENIFGRPQDIEWTMYNDEIFILQSRNVTGYRLANKEKIIKRKGLKTRNIASIYRSYRIPPNLQKHVLQVAAVGAWIVENWSGPEINKANIVETLLLHDLGNLVKADYDKFPYLFPEEYENLKYWQAVQKWMIDRYGDTDRKATLNIAEEIGVSDRILGLLKGKQFVHNENTYYSDDFELKICSYSDQRVSPYGILPIKERLREAVKRYKGVKNASVNDPKREMLIDYATKIEEQIFQHVGKSPDEIHELAVETYYKELRNYTLSL